MAGTSCWSLWQKMPPRYQLTIRGQTEADDDTWSNEEKTPRSVRTPTPQRRSPGPETPIPHIAGFSPRGEETSTNPRTKRKLFFPRRKSVYVDHLKTQSRINSARVNIAENPFIPPYSAKKRAKTAPILSPRASEKENFMMQKTSLTSATMRSDTRLSENSLKLRIPTGNSITTKEDKLVTSPDETNSCTKGHVQRKFVVRETEEGTIYIDNGKVVFFLKNKNNAFQVTKSSTRDGEFFANLRKKYLSKPYIGKTTKPQTAQPAVVDEVKVERERQNYNTKVSHILDYYDDEDQLSLDDLSRYANPQNTRRSESSRLLSPRVRKMNLCVSPRSPQSTCRYESIHSLNSYFKVNSRVKLHERNFYLQTPGFQPFASEETRQQIEDCKCGICRIEMQLRLLAQLGRPVPVAEFHAMMRNQNIEPPVTASKPEVPQKQDPTCIENKTAHTEDTAKSTHEDETNEQFVNRTESLTITLPEMTPEREQSLLAETARDSTKD